jgi:hypothetical protein
MSVRIMPKPRLYIIAVQTVRVGVLLVGFVLVAKSAFEIINMQHVTTNSLSWSSGGLLLLLIGSLTNSFGRRRELDLPSPEKPEC